MVSLLDLRVPRAKLAGKNPNAASHALPNPVFWEAAMRDGQSKLFNLLARPERFELPTPRFVVWCSIQLSYGRVGPLEGHDSKP
jgi:hypothetical protein